MTGLLYEKELKRSKVIWQRSAFICRRNVVICRRSEVICWRSGVICGGARLYDAMILVATMFCLQRPRAAHALCSDQNYVELSDRGTPLCLSILCYCLRRARVNTLFTFILDRYWFLCLSSRSITFRGDITVNIQSKMLQQSHYCQYGTFLGSG